jgi:hypothetical protein
VSSVGQLLSSVGVRVRYGLGQGSDPRQRQGLSSSSQLLELIGNCSLSNLMFTNGPFPGVRAAGV